MQAASKKAELEGDSAIEEVAAQSGVGGTDAIQLRAQEIDEATEMRVVVQRDPLGMHKVARQRQRA